MRITRPVQALDHTALLIDLDGVHRGIGRGIVVALARRGEGCLHGFHAVIENIDKAQQYGRGQIGRAQLGHDFGKADRGCVTPRAHDRVAGFINPEVVIPPVRHVVEVTAVVECPVGHCWGATPFMLRGR